jgi:predicted unusual protein kinase regulating ubiquinone biosynthesis (AarF/ABC1/UbiB family)
LNGKELAVKVQYPYVQQSFAADIKQLHRIAGLASMVTHVDGGALVEELGRRLEEECDYVAESENQQRFALLFDEDTQVRIPEIVRERCATAVLTSDWHDGQSFRDFCETADAASRARAGLTMARFPWLSLLRHRVLNADPHPGNFLFEREQVVFLDFGCVREFNEDFIEDFKRFLRCVLDDDRAHFPERLEALGLVGQRRGFDFDQHWRQARYELEPYSSPEFQFTREYSARSAEFSRPTNPNARKIALPPPYLWILRMQYGLHAVLARLGARGDFRSVMRQALE